MHGKLSKMGLDIYYMEDMIGDNDWGLKFDKAIKELGITICWLLYYLFFDCI